MENGGSALLAVPSARSPRSVSMPPPMSKETEEGKKDDTSEQMPDVLARNVSQVEKILNVVSVAADNKLALNSELSQGWHKKKGALQQTAPPAAHRKGKKHRKSVEMPVAQNNTSKTNGQPANRDNSGSNRGYHNREDKHDGPNTMAAKRAYEKPCYGTQDPNGDVRFRSTSMSSGEGHGQDDFVFLHGFPGPVPEDCKNKDNTGSPFYKDCSCSRCKAQSRTIHAKGDAGPSIKATHSLLCETFGAWGDIEDCRVRKDNRGFCAYIRYVSSNSIMYLVTDS